MELCDLNANMYLMLSKTGKSGAKPCSTPMAPNVQLTKEGELFEDLKRYRKLVGKLNYLIVTRLDITYSVSVSISICHFPQSVIG